MEDADPLLRRVVEQREREKRNVEGYVREGLISAEQGAAIVERLESYLDREERAVRDARRLWPCNVVALETWFRLGPPVSAFGGMAVGLMEYRAPLYVARLAWLEENGVYGTDERDFLLDCWAGLDTRKRVLEIDRLNKAGE